MERNLLGIFGRDDGDVTAAAGAGGSAAEMVAACGGRRCASGEVLGAFAGTTLGTFSGGIALGGIWLGTTGLGTIGLAVAWLLSAREALGALGRGT